MPRLYPEKSLLVLFSMGFFFHLNNFTQYLRDQAAHTRFLVFAHNNHIILPIVDLFLFIVILYSVFALIWEHKAFFNNYSIKYRYKIIYGFVTFCLTQSIGGYLFYIIFKDFNFFFKDTFIGECRRCLGLPSPSFPIPISPFSPVNIYLLYTGDDSYLEHFDWWISPIMMTIYVGMIWFCFSLKPKTE
ncbi:hypothetical protein [Leptospira weilii]|uniref:hypothetical protein n=1 Tax=Leptospira weilii TaxID=28184 RepID=UPI003D9A9796